MPRTASNPHDSAYAKMLRIQAQLSMLLIAAHKTHQDGVIASLIDAQESVRDAMSAWATAVAEEEAG